MRINMESPKQDIPTEFRIIKISIADPEELKTGDICKAVTLTFPSRFDTYETAQEHLKKYIELQSKYNKRIIDNKNDHNNKNTFNLTSVKSQSTTIGYLIVKKPQNEQYKWLHQWSFDAVGNNLTDACTDNFTTFDGRDPSTLPFHKGDYVATYCWGGLILGLIYAEPFTKDKIKELLASGEWEENSLDSTDDCYLVDFTQESHDHPSVASVFPLPFDSSEIPEDIKKALHWADKDKADS